MNQETKPRIEAHIEGDITGQVAIGSHINQIGDVHGNLVIHLSADQRIEPVPRQTPVRILPRPVHDMVNRAQEIGTAVVASDSVGPMEFFGPEGIGKSTLLRYLAHEDPVELSDGVVFIRGRGRPGEDVILDLYQAFIDIPLGFKPTEMQILQALRNVRALIVVDDADMERKEIERLLDAAPECKFILASEVKLLWGEGTSVALKGLPALESKRLMQRELGREFTDEEQEAAGKLCTFLEGNPLRILQVAAHAREDGISLIDLAVEIAKEPPSDETKERVFAPLTGRHKKVLAALALFPGIPVSMDRLSQITRVKDLSGVLRDLSERRLVMHSGTDYAVPRTSVSVLQRMWDLNELQESSREAFIRYLESSVADLGKVAEEKEAIITLLEDVATDRQWQNVIRLGRASEGAFAWTGMWGMWGRVLEWILTAAQSVSDQRLEAWAFHQLGTRAQCLGKLREARNFLTNALTLRVKLEDHVGAAVTQHNLDILEAPPASPGCIQRVVTYTLRGVGILAAATVLYAIVSNGGPEPPDGPTVEPVVPSDTTISVRLSDGCNHSYFADERIDFHVAVDGKGELEISVDGQLLDTFSTPIDYQEPWIIEDLTAGEHVISVVFRDAEGRVSTSESCVFDVVVPEITLGLASGCNASLRQGSSSSLELSVNAEREASVWLDDEIPVEGPEIHSAGDVWSVPVETEGLSVGDHAYRAELYSLQGEVIAEASCGFSVLPTPSVEVWLAEGCDREYVRTYQTWLVVSSASGGEVDITVDDSLFKHFALEEGTEEEIDFPFDGHEDGKHQIEAKLTNDDGDVLASSTCVFTVATPEVLFDFIANAPQAEWIFYCSDGTKDDKFPGNRLVFGDESTQYGFARISSEVTLEDGRSAMRILETAPPKCGGFIIGVFPKSRDVDLMPGDEFSIAVGLSEGSEEDFFLISINLLSGSYIPSTFESMDIEIVDIDQTYKEFDGSILWWTGPIDDVLGQEGMFAFFILGNEESLFERGLFWIEARLIRP